MEAKSLSIHLTDCCNSSCIFCVVNSHKNSTECVDKKVIEKFLRDNRKLGYEAVNIHGGEPTVCKELPLLLDKIKEYGYKFVSLQTNARLMSDIEYAKTLIGKGIKKYVISLHGDTDGLHDSITLSPDSFKQTVQGIKNLKKLKDVNTKLMTNTVACKQNYKSLTKIARKAIDIGIEHINLSAVHTKNRALYNFNSVVPRYTVIKPYIIEMVEYVVANNVPISLEGFPYCALPGCEDYIVKRDLCKIKLLFHSILMTDYRDYMDQEQKKQHEKCQKCVYADICGGVYEEYQDRFGWDEFSPIVRC